jgi:acyl-CoA dehydrogenase
MGCRRALAREAFRKTVAEQGVVQDWIAESRLEIDQARLLTMDAAFQMDAAGNKAARNAISSIKVVVPRMACAVIDRMIQIYGGAGVSDDFPLAAMYAGARTLRIADGPDEVHKMVIARRELSRYAE